MSTFSTPRLEFPSNAGMSYPNSGRLLARAVDWLRMRGYLDAGEKKTLQRLDKGEVIRDPEALLELLLEAFFPKGLVIVTALHNLKPSRDCCMELLRSAWSRWNRTAAQMNGTFFPLVEKGWETYPFLRLFFLDLGLRWGAYQALRSQQGESPSFRPMVLEEDAPKRLMDQYRKEQTLEELLTKTNITKNTLDNWRAGNDLPREDNLLELANALAGKGNLGLADSIMFELRLAFGIAHGRKLLVEALGPEGASWVSDLIEAFVKTAELSYQHVRWLLPISQEELPAVYLNLIEDGARAQQGGAGAVLCRRLAEKSEWNKEVQADFRALPFDWSMRLNYWSQALAEFSSNPTIEVQKTLEQIFKGKLNASLLAQIPKIGKSILFRMKDFDGVPGSAAQVAIVPQPDEAKAMNRIHQAERARSYCDFEEAIGHLRRAIELAPKHAGAHFMLGAYLGELVSRGELKNLIDAVRHCRIAQQLEPKWQSPPTEVALLLSNVWTFTQDKNFLVRAENAFNQAFEVAKDWHHFHKCRGNNYLWMGKFAEAERSFGEAVRLKPSDFWAHAGRLAALSQLGRPTELCAQLKELRRFLVDAEPEAIVRAVSRGTCELRPM